MQQKNILDSRFFNYNCIDKLCTQKYVHKNCCTVWNCILESEDQLWRAKEQLDSVVTTKNHELAEKLEEISSLQAKEREVQKDVQKYRVDIMAFIKDIDDLEKEIEEKDKINRTKNDKIEKLTSELVQANSMATDAVRTADKKNGQLSDLVQKFFDHNTKEAFEYDRKK